MTDEVHATFITNDPLEPLDTGEPGFRLTGLKDVQGTFSGRLDEGIAALFSEPGAIQMLYFYGPDPKTPWWKHWFYRVREVLFEGSRWFPEFPYPTVVVASGPANLRFEDPIEDGDDVVFTGEFTSTGHWDFK